MSEQRPRGEGSIEESKVELAAVRARARVLRGGFWRMTSTPTGSSVTFFARNPLNIVVPKTGAEKWLTQLCLGNVQKFLVATSSNKLCHWKSIGACDFTHIDRHFSTHLRRVCRSLDRLGGIMLMELPVSRWLYLRCRISLGKCA